MFHVGLDVHQRTSTMCILDSHGQRVKTQTIRGPWSHLLAACRAIPRPFEICFEATCGYGYLHEQLLQMASRVVVAHPGQLRLIFRSKRKNDRIDAGRLAKLLFLDEVPAAYVPDAHHRQWREMIEYRQSLVAQRTGRKNALRALLRSRGIVSPKSLWSRKGLAWLAGVDVGDVWARFRRDLSLSQLAALEKQIHLVTQGLDAMGRDDPGVRLLRTIPGVGPRTAEAVVAYVADPRRFSRTRQAGAYFGLVPSQDASAGVNRLGRITREGPATVRKLLTEAAWQVIRRCPAARERFDRVRQDKADRRKKALVAVAHWLVRCMVRMLQNNESWRMAA